MSIRYIAVQFLVATIVAFVAAYVYYFVLSNHSKVKGLNTTETIRNTALSIWQNCQGETAACYEEGAKEELVDKFSAVEILSALYDFDQYFSCHGFTHYVGRALYKKYGSVADAYAEIDFTCHGGTYHGVIEAYLEQKEGGLDSLTGEEIVRICLDSKKKTDRNPVQVFNECLHGMGHAFMFLTDSELPKSLEYCDRLSYKGDQETCYGGAFMENSTSSTNSDHPSKWVSEDDKFYPCTILSAHQLNQCYLYQANYWIKESNYDWPVVFASCGELEGSFKDYCHLGMGSNLAGFSTAKSIEAAAAVCAIAAYDVGEVCVEGAVPALFARYGGEAAKIVEFCSAVAEPLREVCFLKTGFVAKSWGHDGEKVAVICQAAGDYKEACLGNSSLKPKY